MIRHKLKIEENYLKNLVMGTKKSDIRFNDRDYQKGDILEYIYWSNPNVLTWYYFEVTHVHSGVGMQEGYVCLSVTPTNGTECGVLI